MMGPRNLIIHMQTLQTPWDHTVSSARGYRGQMNCVLKRYKLRLEPEIQAPITTWDPENYALPQAWKATWSAGLVSPSARLWGHKETGTMMVSIYVA